MTTLSGSRDTIFVGQILESKQHPNADRLMLATVDYGVGEPMTIITGAPNLKPGDSGQKVAFATLGSILIDPYADGFKTMKLKSGKIRGITIRGHGLFGARTGHFRRARGHHHPAR